MDENANREVPCFSCEARPGEPCRNRHLSHILIPEGHGTRNDTYRLVQQARFELVREMYQAYENAMNPDSEEALRALIVAATGQLPGVHADCGCLENCAGAHRVGCPAFPEGVTV